jgi:hypothetical protein
MGRRSENAAEAELKKCALLRKNALAAYETRLIATSSAKIGEDRRFHLLRD